MCKFNFWHQSNDAFKRSITHPFPENTVHIQNIIRQGAYFIHIFRGFHDVFLRSVNSFWDIPEVYYLWSASHFTDAKAEALIIWPPDVNSWLTGKEPDAGKDWGKEEKWTTEDEMGGWHHRLNGHGFGGLQELVMDREVCCDSWGRKESDTTERLRNWETTELRNS